MPHMQERKHWAKECWSKYGKDGNTLLGNSNNTSKQQGNRLMPPPFRPWEIRGLKSRNSNICVSFWLSFPYKLLLKEVLLFRFLVLKMQPFHLFNDLLSYIQNIGDLYCLAQLDFYWVTVVYPWKESWFIQESLIKITWEKLQSWCQGPLIGNLKPEGKKWNYTIIALYSNSVVHEGGFGSTYKTASFSTFEGKW